MGLPLVMHHHDWWFDNRWQHFATMRRAGFRTLRAMAAAILPASRNITHLSVNRTDATLLARHFLGAAGWLPNPIDHRKRPSPSRAAAAGAWLRAQLGDDAPVWVVPCRLLRRKNLAEAILLARWLRPEAWLVTTGGVSSAEESAYAETLAQAARAGSWRVRFGLLQGAEHGKPAVPDLLAASEAVVFTSLFEGFGLPYLEAAAAGRPLLARRLLTILPDLQRFCFRFPQTYEELLVEPSLFDWRAERDRQRLWFTEWRSLMPRAAACLVGQPIVLAQNEPGPVPFSRLTLTAQCEVLAQPIEESRERCLPLNPFLVAWREKARTGVLRPSPWPKSAARFLGSRAYARSFFEGIPTGWGPRANPTASSCIQTAFLRQKLRSQNLYPLLWRSTT